MITPRGRTRVALGALVAACALALGAGGASAQGGMPAHFERCHDGGWQDLFTSGGTQFRNQGECMSYAARGGSFVTVSLTPTGLQEPGRFWVRAQASGLQPGSLVYACTSRSGISYCFWAPADSSGSYDVTYWLRCGDDYMFAQVTTSTGTVFNTPRQEPPC